MKLLRRWKTWLAGALAVAALADAAAPGWGAQASGSDPVVYGPRPFAGELGVLTYNVHGLPWPIATGRAARLDAIAARLRLLHALGEAPEVVVLQEAFTGEARAIGRDSGYRYVAFGPASSDRLDAREPAGSMWDSLERGRNWLKGETFGRFTGSGLAILSDYPIEHIRRMTFTAPMCAGYDCLAAKGAMMAELRLPGGRRVEIATTHMNSRGAADVAPLRTDLAWNGQSLELADFIRANRNAALPLVLGGDFNVGRTPGRRRDMAEMIARLGSGVSDGLRSLAQAGARLAPDAMTELVRAKDWQLSVPGLTGTLRPVAANVPFGAERPMPLSDHFGYAITYRIEPGRTASQKTV